MASAESFPLVAVDIGNSRIKLGVFDLPGETGSLPAPIRWLMLETAEWDPLEIALWLAPQPPSAVAWRIASVHRGAAARLMAWLELERAAAAAVQLCYQDLSLAIDLPAPESVGIDRLLGAVAANALRGEREPAIVIDVGSAITVDLVSAQGAFRGGAILPGIGMSARALHEFTDLLPDLGISTLEEPPPALGTSTRAAIASGLFWGAVGAMRTLVERLAAQLDSPPLVLLTGGAAESVAGLLPGRIRYEPHLVLSGIAIATAGK